MSGAVAGAHRFEDVLEVVAVEACRVLGASGVSIARWEPEHDRLRTLVAGREVVTQPLDDTQPLARRTVSSSSTAART